MPDLAIVIVNYNTRDLLRDCLLSVRQQTTDNRQQTADNRRITHHVSRFTSEVWVVDNASTDGSAAMVQEEFPEVRLIANERNVGFAAANNQALREMFRDSSFEFRVNGPTPKPEIRNPKPGTRNLELAGYILLLNPDTVLPPNALAHMIAFMEAHPEAGVAGPKLVRQDGSLDLACRRSFPTPEVSFYRIVGLSRLFPRSRRFARYNLTYLDPDQVTEVDSVVGAFMLLRGEAIAQVGLLDESFFMYGEDLDWCYRIKRAGWKVFYNPQVTVLHYKREASKQNQQKARYEFYRAMHLFYRKHYAAETPRWLHWLILGGIVLRGGPALAGEVWRRRL
jgi:hypothetical protein